MSRPKARVGGGGGDLLRRWQRTTQRGGGGERRKKQHTKRTCPREAAAASRIFPDVGGGRRRCPLVGRLSTNRLGHCREDVRTQTHTGQAKVSERRTSERASVAMGDYEL